MTAAALVLWRWGAKISLRGEWFGVSFACCGWRPEAGTIGGRWGTRYRYAQAFGVALWRDNTPSLTVGERGAW